MHKMGLPLNSITIVYLAVELEDTSIKLALTVLLAAVAVDGYQLPEVQESMDKGIMEVMQEGITI
jgi:hypothetical protein